MKLGSFCTGYGGLDMACEAHFGADLAWYSEVDKDCNQLLAHHWPGVPNLGDLTAIDWDQVEPVDILCAGFPCQPFSHAGKREGENDERAIFAHIADGISVLRPGIVVLENVAGLLTLGGPGVVATLAGLGYVGRAGVVSAKEAGAPHLRRRWFCIARNPDPSGRATVGTVQEQEPEHGRTSGFAADTAGVGFGERAGSGESKPTGQRRDGPGDGHRTAPTDTDDSRQPLDGANDGTPGGRRHGGSCIARGGETPTDASALGSQSFRKSDQLEEASRESCRLSRFGPYEPAIERWERVLGRRAPDPTDDRGLRPEFVSWMMGLPEGFVCDLGLSRTAELKMLGNGVCPAQAKLALEILDG